jgi:hypothetical protein
MVAIRVDRAILVSRGKPAAGADFAMSGNLRKAASRSSTRACFLRQTVHRGEKK